MQINAIEALSGGFLLTQSVCNTLCSAALSTMCVSLPLYVMPLPSIRPSIITVCNNYITEIY
jgi:hypothetical protein